MLLKSRVKWETTFETVLQGPQTASRQWSWVQVMIEGELWIPLVIVMLHVAVDVSLFDSILSHYGH